MPSEFINFLVKHVPNLESVLLESSEKYSVAGGHATTGYSLEIWVRGTPKKDGSRPVPLTDKRIYVVHCDSLHEVHKIIPLLVEE